MYNYSLKLTYRKKNDTIYRKELLEAFHLKEYTDKINERIDDLYKTIKNDYSDIIKCLHENDPLTSFGSIDEAGCFMILFSWQYFYENHSLIQSIFQKSDDILVKKKTLIDKIISNKK
jgi:hypothetical protein